MLLVEQNAQRRAGRRALRLHHGERQASSSTAAPRQLVGDPDVRDFYLGLGDGGDAHAASATSSTTSAASAGCREAPRCDRDHLHETAAAADAAALGRTPPRRDRRCGRRTSASGSRSAGRDYAAARRATSAWACVRAGPARRASRVAVLGENRNEWVFAQTGRGAGRRRSPSASIRHQPAHEVDYVLALCRGTEVIVCEDQEQTRQGAGGARPAAAPARASSSSSRGPARATSADGLHELRRCRRSSASASRDDRPTRPHRGQRSRPDARRHRPDDLHLGLDRPAEGRDDELARLRGVRARARSTCSARTPRRLARVVPAAVPRGRADVHGPSCRCTCGSVVNFGESLRTVQEDLREIAPQIFLGVPRIWEKLHSLDPDQAARGRRPAARAVPACDGLAAGRCARCRAPTWSARAAAALGVLVRAHPALAAELRRPAPLPRRDLGRRADRARDRCASSACSACRSARSTA